MPQKVQGSNCGAQIFQAEIREAVCFRVPSLKLTAKAPGNGRLEDEFPWWGKRPKFRGYLSFRECN